MTPKVSKEVPSLILNIFEGLNRNNALGKPNALFDE